jgi:hypothetical protein
MKFLGLQIDNYLNWKNHIEQMIPNLSASCCTVRSMVHISNFNTLKSIYNAYFHSIIKYELNVWGNSTNSGKIFTLQKKIVRIMAGAQLRTSCRSLFKQLEIPSVPCPHVLSLMNFIINRMENFYTYSSIHNINKRNKRHLLGPMPAYLVVKSTFWADIKIISS